MKTFNIFIVLSLVLLPFAPLANASILTQSKSPPSYELLTFSEMIKLVGGAAVGQLEIASPDNERDISGDGSVSYQVNYQDVSATETLYIALIDVATETPITLYTGSVSGSMGSTASGSRTGTLDSADANGYTLLTAELLGTSGSATDYCEDGTDTVFARSLIYLIGDGT